MDVDYLNKKQSLYISILDNNELFVVKQTWILHKHTEG